MLDIARDRRKTLKKLFYEEECYIFLENILEKVYIITFVFQFLSAGVYLKCIDETKTPIEMYTGLVLQNLYFDPKHLNRLDILTGILIAMDFSLFFQRSTFNLEKKQLLMKFFFSPCKSNWIYVPRNYFSNYVYLKDIHINLKGIGKILFITVLTNLLICKFLNFASVFTN